MQKVRILLWVCLNLSLEKSIFEDVVFLCLCDTLGVWKWFLTIWTEESAEPYEIYSCINMGPGGTYDLIKPRMEMK